MLNHPVMMGSGCCALCGIIINNSTALLVSLVVAFMIWAFALIHIIIKCRKMDKTLVLLHERGLRRATTNPNTAAQLHHLG